MPAKDQIKEVNFEQLRTLVRIQCTAEECAAILDMSADTLDTRLKEAGYAGFSEFYKRYNHEAALHCAAPSGKPLKMETRRCSFGLASKCLGSATSKRLNTRAVSTSHW